MKLKFTKKEWRMLIMVTISAVIYSFAMKIFVETGNLFPGGFSGLSRMIVLMLSTYANIHVSFGAVYLLLHILPTVLVYKYVGRHFTIFSFIQFSLVSLLTSMLPEFTLTQDPLLIAVFGGIIAGFGISVALRAGASSGGTDFVAIYFANKFHISTWNYVMAFNFCVLCIAGLLFGWNVALYSIIYQFCSTQVVNLRHDRYKLTTLMVVTDHPDLVSQTVYTDTNHSSTIIHGEGSYSRAEKSILFITINSYQAAELIGHIRKVEPRVFINVMKTERVVGNYYSAPMD